MKLHRLLAVAALLLTFALLSLQSFAQATVSFAQLNGTVLDEGGRTVTKASITMRDVGTNQTYTAMTNETGYYVVPALPPGRYELTVSYPGFGKFVQTGIGLSLGQTATIM
jgi:hypothetical protein